MGVVRHLVRTAAVEALRGKTLAGVAVFNSKIEALGDLLKDGQQPVVIVSIEECKQEDHSQDEGSFLGRCSKLTMLVQTAVASGKEIQDADGTRMIAGIGESDASFEATLDILDRQWRIVLGDNENSWSSIFRGLVTRVERIVDTRAVDPETGRKHALRFTNVTLEVVDEPLPGDGIPDVIEAGLAAMEEDGSPVYAEIVTTFRASLAVGADWPDWRKLQSQLFLPRDAMPALGRGPIGIDDLVDFERANLAVSGIAPVTVTKDD